MSLGPQIQLSTKEIVRELRLIRKELTWVRHGVSALLNRGYAPPRGKVSKQPKRKYQPDDGFPGRE